MPKRKGKLQRRARRDVGLVIRPQLRELGRQKRQARQEYRDYDAKMGSLYGILDKTLAGANTQQQAALGGIQDTYSGGVQGILSGLGQSTAPDQAAFLNTLGSFALGNQNTLSTNAAREANLGSSMRRQGGLERMQLGRNARDDLQEVLDDIRFSRRGIMADRGAMVMSRLDQLREDAFSRNMALKELALRAKAVNQQAGNDAATLALVRDLGGNALGGNRRRKKKRRRTGGSRSTPGTATVPPGSADRRRMG